MVGSLDMNAVESRTLVVMKVWAQTGFQVFT
jgi:hypothetical protein